MKKLIHEKIEIISKEEVGSEIFLLKLKSSGIAGRCAPGQFLHIKINGKSLRRPISISSKEKNHINIIFKIKGTGTTILSKKKKGECIDVLGPLGNSFPLVEGKRPLFVAGGLGAAPLNFLASIIKSKGIFIYGTAKEEDFFPLNHQHKLIKISEAKDKKLVTDLLPLYIKDVDIIYAAGPREMLKIIAQICRKEEKDGYISWEERMGCGIGLCQACAVKTIHGYKRTCVEGPVFNLKEINWNEY